ncbi:MAG: BamA/TamA family outer membrane protein, partial [Ignavibacteria bacterium]|nr:BamA/TamA family outer membrane protein [Ignavibacteria bacterium]
YKAYFGLRSDHVWSFRTMIGSGDNTLPLSQQFSLGGQNSFLGLREYEFRGRQVFLSSLEVRYKLPVKLFFDTYIRARYDLGSVWGKREAIRFRDLRHGAGITVSFNTPIGPADFSVGKSFYFKNELPRSTIVRGPTFFYFTIGYYY